MLFEFALVVGAAEVIPIPAVVLWPWFGLTLIYAAIEFWAGGVAGEAPHAESPGQ